MNRLIGMVISLIAILLMSESCEKNPEPIPETVTDICGNTYKTVVIGNQVWMAENLASTKYDTESERAGEILQKGFAKYYGYKPYYTDSRIRADWSDKGFFSEKLTDEQISKLGLLYSWSAAMGYTADEAYNETGAYKGDRQGICPNGWHIPSKDEWDKLENTVRTLSEDAKSGFEGRYLKSNSGWHSDGNGTDDFNFCILPAGGSGDEQINSVGGYSQIWSSTAYNKEEAYDEWTTYKSDDIVMFDSLKENARSVRCIKNTKHQNSK